VIGELWRKLVFILRRKRFDRDLDEEPIAILRAVVAEWKSWVQSEGSAGTEDDDSHEG